MIRRQRGTALLLVLWVTVLLAALLIGVAAASRSQSQAALYGAERVRAELAAEAGLAHAVAGLRAPDLRDQWVPDGRPYDFEFDGAKSGLRLTASFVREKVPAGIVSVLPIRFPPCESS